MLIGMNRKDLAGMLEYAADLMEVLGEGDFRVQAYRKAARNLEKSEADLQQLAQQKFVGVAGIGPALAPLLAEAVQNGELAYIAELEAQLPPGVLEFFRVPGLGPKRIRTLWEHGLDSLIELIRAAEAQQLRNLPGFGAKTEANLLEAARFSLQGMQRMLLTEAQDSAALLLADLKLHGISAQMAGSFRRGLESVGNLDVVALATPQQVAQALGPAVQSVGSDFVEGRLGGLALRVVCASEQNFGTQLVLATGSSAFVQALGALPIAQSEHDLFAALGVAEVPPYWREPQHMGLTPPPPLQRSELQGLIHLHSTYSDGAESLRTMALAAIEQGYSYMVIADHSQSAAYAGGMRPQTVQQQWQEIERLNAELAPFRILRGIESDILPDGSLDYPQEMLQGFEVVIGSLHSGLALGQAEQTQRLLRAVQNPHLHILGHPSARLLLRRKEVAVNWDEVLDAAAKHQVIVEINCNPHRADLDWRLALQWRDRLNFSLGTDAHSLAGLQDIDFGLHLAHKAGLRSQQVVNTWPLERWLSAP